MNRHFFHLVHKPLTESWFTLQSDELSSHCYMAQQPLVGILLDSSRSSSWAPSMSLSSSVTVMLLQLLLVANEASMASQTLQSCQAYCKKPMHSEKALSWRCYLLQLLAQYTDWNHFSKMWNQLQRNCFLVATEAWKRDANTPVPFCVYIGMASSVSKLFQRAINYMKCEFWFVKKD